MALFGFVQSSTLASPVSIKLDEGDGIGDVRLWAIRAADVFKENYKWWVVDTDTQKRIAFGEVDELDVILESDL
jgi:hypothetical protein